MRRGGTEGRKEGRKTVDSRGRSSKIGEEERETARERERRKGMEKRESETESAAASPPSRRDSASSGRIGDTG